MNATEPTAAEYAVFQARIDVAYALDQLKQHRCIERAIDSLERALAALEDVNLEAE